MQPGWDDISWTSIVSKKYDQLEVECVEATPLFLIAVVAFVTRKAVENSSSLFNIFFSGNESMFFF